jgi:hypothetical protein
MTWPILWRLTASGPVMAKAADQKAPYVYWPGVEHWQPGYCWQWVYTATSEEDYAFAFDALDTVTDSDLCYHAALTQRAWLCALVSMLEVLNDPSLIRVSTRMHPPGFRLVSDAGPLDGAPAFVLPGLPAHLQTVAPELAAKVAVLPPGSVPFHLGPGLVLLPGGKK